MYRTVYIYTHTRYGSQFVSSPSSALFCPRYQKSVVFFFDSNHSILFQFFFFRLVVWARSCSDFKNVWEEPTFYSMVDKENVVELDATTRQYWFFQKFSIIFMYIQYRLRPDVVFLLFSNEKKKHLKKSKSILECVYKRDVVFLSDWKILFVQPNLFILNWTLSVATSRFIGRVDPHLLCVIPPHC